MDVDVRDWRKRVSFFSTSREWPISRSTAGRGSGIYLHGLLPIRFVSETTIRRHDQQLSQYGMASDSSDLNQSHIRHAAGTHPPAKKVTYLFWTVERLIPSQLPPSQRPNPILPPTLPLALDSP